MYFPKKVIIQIHYLDRLVQQGSSERVEPRWSLRESNISWLEHSCNTVHYDCQLDGRRSMYLTNYIYILQFICYIHFLTYLRFLTYFREIDAIWTLFLGAWIQTQNISTRWLMLMMALAPSSYLIPMNRTHLCSCKYIHTDMLVSVFNI